MARVFIKLYLLLVVALGIFIAIVVNLDDVLHDTIEGHLNKLAFGTLSLLEQQLSTMTGEQQQAYINEINAFGGYPIELGKVDDFDLTAEQRERIRRQGFVSLRRGEAPYIYRAILQQGRIVKVPFAQSSEQDEIRLTRSTFAILEQELRKFPQQQWPRIIDKVGLQFAFPVTLMNIDQVNLPEKKQALLLAGRTAWYQIDENTEYDYRRIPGSDQVIRLGPFSEPATLDHLEIGLLVLLAAVVGATTLIWLVSMWRDVKALDKTTKRFGQGEFTERTKIKKGSAVFSLAHTFNSMAERIQALISSHKELTNAVSHELRTPIARLRFGIEMLENTDDEQDRLRYLQSMNADIDELDKLVAELLTYARFDRDHPQFEFRRIHLKPWIEDLVKRFSAQAVDRQFEYQISDPQLSANFDPRLMTRAMNNLLDNALRYSNQQISVRIELQSDDLVITVDDDGPGIAEDQRAQVFQPFTRLDRSRDRETGGYGLGLAIVSRIVHWHHGWIRIEDSPLGGARFSMCFPERQS